AYTCSLPDFAKLVGCKPEPGLKDATKLARNPLCPPTAARFDPELRYNGSGKRSATRTATGGFGPQRTAVANHAELLIDQAARCAGVAELADAADSKSAGACPLGGSIPPSSTIVNYLFSITYTQLAPTVPILYSRAVKCFVRPSVHKRGWTSTARVL